MMRVRPARSIIAETRESGQAVAERGSYALRYEMTGAILRSALEGSNLQFGVVDIEPKLFPNPPSEVGIQQGSRGEAGAQPCVLFSRKPLQQPGSMRTAFSVPAVDAENLSAVCAHATQTELTVSPRPHVSRQARGRGCQCENRESSVISKFHVTWWDDLSGGRTHFGGAAKRFATLHHPTAAFVSWKCATDQRS
jgi:hypothetical protein